MTAGQDVGDWVGFPKTGTPMNLHEFKMPELLGTKGWIECGLDGEAGWERVDEV